MSPTKKIEIDTIVSQSPGLVAADMDGAKFMLNIETGKYYGLDGISSRIWELIEQPRAVWEVIAFLLEEYEVGAKTCKNDVLVFLNKLSEQGLVHLG